VTPKWLFFPAPAASGSNWSDYMAAESGGDYFLVPARTGATSQVSGPTAGDGTSTFTKVRASSGASSGTTQSGTTISAPATEFNKGLQGGHNQLSNPYDYAAIGWQEAGDGSFGDANSAGWVVCEREQSAGTGTSNRLSYIPIEGTDGITASTYAGGLPKWNQQGGGANHIVFFFDNYNSGDVDNWTTWDGSTTP
tara:strand:+ start:710 stop:1294 length:585 start_codon:yes stop_codon:yes gene_type:complete